MLNTHNHIPFILTLYQQSLTNSYALTTCYNTVKSCKRKVNSCPICHSCAVSALTDAMSIENEKTAVGQRDVRHNWWLVFLLMDSGWDWNEKTSNILSLNQKYSPVAEGAKLALSSGSKHSHFPRSQTVLFFFLTAIQVFVRLQKGLFLETWSLRCQTHLDVTFIFKSH